MSANLSARQRQMVCDSSPDARDRSSGYGVELSSGADYAVAKALKRRELGSYEQGQWGLCGLYFNNADGLQLRADLLGLDDDPDQGHDPDADCLKWGWS